MNKFIIFALLFVFVLNQTEEDDSGSYEVNYTGKNRDKCLEVNDDKPSAKNCNSITLDQGYNCCYLSGKDNENEYNLCLPLNETEVKDFQDEAKEDDEIIDYSIICS